MKGQLNLIRDKFICDIRAHPFLMRCRTGRISLPEMTLFLIQQELYSRHFTRYLCALMSNLNSNAQVHALAANLFEELGFDKKDAIPHSVLFRKMLTGFGVIDTDSSIPLPATDELVAVMYTQCRDADFARGLGALCLGAEALVPELYSDIVAGFESLGDQGDRIDFFRIHIECDDGHAETMQEILEDLLDHDPLKLDLIENAGRTAVDARLKFFDNIEEFT